MSDAGSSGKHYLAGETVEEWQALSLRNLWTVEDTVQLLKTGQNRFATVSGNMVDVTDKAVTSREAVAQAVVRMRPETLEIGRAHV